MDKYVLLTGGTGFIGSHCAVELLQQGYNIIILDNYSNSSEIVINKITEIVGDKANNMINYQIDIRDKNLLNLLFLNYEISVVIHFAAYKAVKESIDNPLKYYNNNLMSLIILLECMEEHNVNKIIFSSSATVYGSPSLEDLPLSENSKLKEPLNPYGKTKLYCENIIKDVVVNNNIKAIILRYFNPVGAHPTGFLGESPLQEATNLFPYIYDVLLGKRTHLNIYGSDYSTPDGTAIRDYIHIVDLAKGHLSALNKILDDDINYEIFNLGTGKGYSVLEVVNMFQEVTNLKVNHKFVERRQGDAPEVYSDVTKSLKELSWSSNKDLKDMVIDSWNYINN